MNRKITYSFLLIFLCQFYCSGQSVTQIGYSTYDLQSNASAGRKLINYGNGKLAAVWIFSPDFSGTDLQRGSGFNFFNGTSWLSTPSSRSEPVRTSNATITRIGSGREAILSDLDSPFDFELGKNLSSGSPTFIWVSANASVAHAPSNTASSYASVASGGADSNTLHLVSVYSDTGVVVNGIHAPFVYSRSSNAGVSWPIKAVFLTGYDSTRTRSESPNTYDIDASGNLVSIVLGGLSRDVSLWQSINNGTSFTKTIVDSFAYVPDMLASAPLNDTVRSNDGAVTVMIDDLGHTHLAYSESRIVKIHPATGPDELQFFPNTIGLVYWNDITHTKVHVPIPLAQLDANGDGVYSVGKSTTALHPDVPNGIYGAARYGNTSSLLTSPSIAMDASGAIYLIFSLPADGDSTGDGQSYRDIWAVKSTTNGTSWSCPVNITHSAGIEEAFPVVAKLVDSKIHILFQEDFEPGTRILNGDDNDQQIINYMSVDKNFADVFAPTISASGPLCNGHSVFLSSSTCPNYLWTGGSTSQGISVSTPGWYKVSTTNSCGFTGIDSIYLAYEPLPVAHITITGDTSFCIGTGSVVLKADISSSYRWTTGAITQQLTLNSISQSGTYKVTTFNLCGDSAVSAPVHILISPFPSPPTIASTSSGFTASPGGMVYQWYIDGNPVTGETGQTFTPSDPTLTNGKAITVMITDTNGCSAVSSEVMGMKEKASLFDSFFIFPNPAKEKVILKIPEEMQSYCTLELFDIAGRIVLTKEKFSNTGLGDAVSISSLKPGVYFIRIRNEENSLQKKLMVY